MIALTRRDGDGLWIPNLDKGTWEASHPEGHSALLNERDPNNASLRGTRRKVIRHLKVWNKQFATPVFSSFHLSVLALEFVKPGLAVYGIFVRSGSWTGLEASGSGRSSVPHRLALGALQLARVTADRVISTQPAKTPDVRVTTLHQHLEELDTRLKRVAVFDQEERHVPIHMDEEDPTA